MAKKGRKPAFLPVNEADLDPGIQHGPVAPAAANAWRHLFGPEGGDAPFFVRNAVDFLTGKHQDARLREVTLALCAEIALMTGKAATLDEACRQVDAALDSGRATDHFSRMVAALGGPADFVDTMDRHLAPAPIIRDVFAAGQGIISSIDTRGVGMAVVALGGGRATPTDRIDYRVGFDRLAPLGAMADGQTPIARIHAADEASAADAEARLRRAYGLGGDVPSNPLIAGRIGQPA